MIRRLLRRPFGVVRRWIAGKIDVPDPWEALGRRVPVGALGPGSRHRLEWYFEGTSAIPVASVEQVCEWLRTCEYASDLELFHESDYWQHPRAFERIRKGDCEDFALWAWRKLVELGLEAHFVIGSTRAVGVGRWHAWVLLERDGRRWLLEPAHKDPSSMLRPFEEAGPEYIPYYSVSPRFDRRSYAGLFLYWRDAQAQMESNKQPNKNLEQARPPGIESAGAPSARPRSSSSSRYPAERRSETR